MRDIIIQPNAETPSTAEPAKTGKAKARVLAASKPYITVFLLVMILLSVWAELCPG